jgi:murein DD-endopeptidase MepM/ murein hydrolase activator NlpD
MAVNNKPPLVLGYPLKGKNWVAEGAISPNSYHLRALSSLDKKIYLSQRFAVDWVQINAEGQEVQGDLSKPKNWLAYGQDVLAVCDGVVTKVQDGFDDQIPPGLPDALGSREEWTGNTILLSTEHGGETYYIMYAHLVKGSITVKPGDPVVKGQVIAKLGNSGNSAAPHLHFHVVNVNDTIKGEGLPYVFKQAKIQGTADVIAMDYGQWQWNEKMHKGYTLYENVTPLINQVFDFSEK